MPPRVSVIVRTKNRPDFLARALLDVAAQRFDDREVIVVNDGGDRVAVEQAASAYRGQIEVVDAVDPGGRCAAANTGVGAARGEFLVLHDDDDLWDPHFLDRTVTWLDAHPGDAAVAVATAIAYEQHVDGVWVETSRVPFWEGMTRVSLSDMLEVNRIVPIAVLYRKELHDRLGGYDERLGTVEDWEFFLRVLATCTIGFIPGDPLAVWTQRPSATGMAANSMFALDRRHVEDDRLVRDRELRKWVAENGIGLPLYLAEMERRVLDRVDATAARLHGQLREEIDAHQPIASRLRRLRRRLGRRNTT